MGARSNWNAAYFNGAVLVASAIGLPAVFGTRTGVTIRAR